MSGTWSLADSPHAPLRWAAEIAAGVAVKYRNDPALPITQVLLTVAPPSQENDWSFTEQDSLLYEGLSVFAVADDGTVSVLRLTTTYQTNPAGMADDSYLDVETLNTLAYVIRVTLTTSAGRTKVVQVRLQIAQGVASMAPVVPLLPGGNFIPPNAIVLPNGSVLVTGSGQALTI
ncbi:hypothetical protein AA101099_1398 [Neoasaia chiangmaiensis NBRC 101099]|uniref:Uncharacterized protein n=1 Tax=Neoasaia chiangmaiensis TaxID=320497 RepID=A0A1U9KQ98_9PROT|nr:hypothetical protein [Neoasaia chiangmaiensis]AQS88014.1 hypothetical protein A0U93_08735 [Neoasaia chiangmaiensis]GBR38845.1 hypothetical protein AA101099_1398 [Neoasaia chiangmaiensis NBRC 101099]GEN15684.1 hypothetical protein NCH01_21150 [Neoasaia chiangmaiensis]